MLSPSSTRRTRIRSCSGVNDVFDIAYISLLRIVGANPVVIWQTELFRPQCDRMSLLASSPANFTKIGWNWQRLRGARRSLALKPSDC
jgi:hypothetical protein